MQLPRFMPALCLTFAATPAHAHPGGGHAHMSLSELVRHYAEPDHLVFFALAVVIGLAAFGIGRRIEAKARKTIRKPDGEHR